MNKPTKHPLFLLLLLLLWLPDSAQAYYNPQTGRWLNRDPIGELGFRLLVGGRQDFVDTNLDDFPRRLNRLLKEPGGLSHYGFVGNDPLDHPDPLGLLKFDGCTSDQQKQLQDQLNAYCGKLKNSLPGCCLNKTILPRLENLCKNHHNYTIKCESASTGTCKNACGWSVPGGSTVHFCPEGWNSQSCGPLGCTLIHEFTHIIGHPLEKWPKQVEKCLGCP